MADTQEKPAAAERALVLERVLRAPRASVWRCWTEAGLLKQWFVPAPWTVAEVSLDLRPGGLFHLVMRSPEGDEHGSPGCFLQIVPERRLVFTDAFTADWQPSDAPFFTADIRLDDASEGTHYVARAMHWREEDRRSHEAMGFHDGWGRCADQLESLAQSLA